MKFYRERRYDRDRRRLRLPQRDNSGRGPRSSRDHNTPTPHQPKTIDISINLDSFPKLSDFTKFSLPTRLEIVDYARDLSFKQRAGIVAAVIIVAAAGTLAIGLRTHTAADGTDPAKVAGSPHYETVIPDGKSIESLGGWNRISPPNKPPVFAYSDMIGDVPISVSQQELPASFKPNVSEQLAELAKKFSATNKINAGDTVVYIGTSSKGPQSALLTKKNLLILIKTAKKVDEKDWVQYIKSLNYLQQSALKY